MVTAIATNATSVIREGMVVKGGMGKRLGTVSTLVIDPATGKMESFVVRRGLLRKMHKRVSLGQIRHVNSDSVVVRLSLKEFTRLPDAGD